MRIQKFNYEKASAAWKTAKYYTVKFYYENGATVETDKYPIYIFFESKELEEIAKMEYEDSPVERWEYYPA